MGRDAEYVVPYVTEATPRGERTMDIYSRLLEDRIVFLGTALDDGVANSIAAQLLYLAAEDPERDINLYINSPGGSVSAMLALYDTMRTVEPDVATTALGMAASAGAFLLAVGAQGKRGALANARILLHQPAIQGGLGGQVSDIEIHAAELVRNRRRVNGILAAATGHPVEKLERDPDRDYLLGPGEAAEYGLIDHVVSPPDGERR